LYSPDEGALDVGLRAMLQTTLDFLGVGGLASSGAVLTTR